MAGEIASFREAASLVKGDEWMLKRGRGREVAKEVVGWCWGWFGVVVVVAVMWAWWPIRLSRLGKH